MIETKMLVRGRVCRAYTRAYSDPLTLHDAEIVTVVARDTDFPAYMWCTNLMGKGGWVPESYLQIRGAVGRALRDYSAHELTVQVGDTLTLLTTEGGWYWAENVAGEQGWVPVACVG